MPLISFDSLKTSENLLMFSGVIEKTSGMKWVDMESTDYVKNHLEYREVGYFRKLSSEPIIIAGLILYVYSTVIISVLLIISFLRKTSPGREGVGEVGCWGEVKC